VLGGAFSGAEERPRGVVDKVAVDLVGDDDQVVPRRDLAQGSDGGGLGELAGGVVGQGHDHRADPPSGCPGGGDGPGERGGVADAAFARRDGHEVGAGTGERGLGGVANPARLGHRDVGTDGEQQGEQ